MSTERARVVPVVDLVRRALGYSPLNILAAEIVRAWPNEIIVTHKGREYTITTIENRKSRLK